MPSTDEILIDFKVNTQSLDQTIVLLEKLGQIDKKTADAFRASNEAYKKREEAANAAAGATEKLGTETEKGANKSKEALEKTSKSVDGFSKAIDNLARKLVAAFAVERIIAFANESVKAFQEAEKTARLLQVAVGVNGGLQQDFEKLVDQSKELQKISIFSDDDIQKAQTFALQFGLTSDEVQKLIPVIADYASATGKDLNSALEAVIQGINGQGRELKKSGIIVDAEATRAERFADIQEKLTAKFKDQSQIVAQTSAGALEQYKNQLDDIQEEIGSKLAPKLQALRGFFLDLASGANGALDLIGNNLDNLYDDIDRILGVTERIAANQAQATQRITADAIKANKDAIDSFKKEFSGLSLDQLQKKALETFNLIEVKKKDVAGLSAKDAQIQNQLLAEYSNQFVAITALISEKKSGLESDQKSFDIGKATVEQLKERKKLLASTSGIAAQDESDAIDKELEKRKKAAEKQKQIREAAAKDLADFEKEQQQNALVDLAQTEQDKIAIIRDGLLAELELRRVAAGVSKDDPEYLKTRNAINAAADKEASDNTIKNLGEISKAREKSTDDQRKNIFELAKWAIDTSNENKDKEIKNAEDVAARKKQIQIELASTLIDGFFQIQQAQSQAQLQGIEAQRDEQNSAIDDELEALEEKHNKHKISDKKFALEQKRLQAEKEKNDKLAEKKSNEIKHQQDIANRERQLFEIAINTYKGVTAATAALQPGLVPFIIALGATEAALVLATPLPKYHSGKLAKTNSNEVHAIVREDETIFDPQSSRDYEPTFKAIYNKKVSPKLLNDFVNFSLKKDVSDSFAQNVYNSTKIDYRLLAKEIGYEFGEKLRGDKTVGLTNESIRKLAQALEQTHDPRRN